MTQQEGRLAGKRIVVTGAASGIGRATAILAAAEGARLALLDVVDDAPDVTAACAPSGRYWRCDVGDEDAVARTMTDAAEWLGGIDALIHVAGIVGVRDVPVDAFDLAQWNDVIRVNTTGAFLAVKHATPHLEESRGAAILTGSGAGVFNGHRSLAYGASKGGLNGLVLTLEVPLRARGIRIHNVAPTAVDTPLLRDASNDETVNTRRARGEVVSAESIAAIMTFLASDAASAVRGIVRTW